MEYLTPRVDTETPHHRYHSLIFAPKQSNVHNTHVGQTRMDRSWSEHVLRMPVHVLRWTFSVMHQVTAMATNRTVYHVFTFITQRALFDAH